MRAALSWAVRIQLLTKASPSLDGVKPKVTPGKAAEERAGAGPPGPQGPGEPPFPEGLDERKAGPETGPGRSGPELSPCVEPERG